MFKPLSMLMMAGVTMIGGVSSAQAGGCCANGGAAPVVAPAPAPVSTSRAPRAPASTAQGGRQTIRRYSAAPATNYRAPAMRSYRSNRSSGPSYSATRKILGY